MTYDYLPAHARRSDASDEIVDILLATHNNAKYLAALMESLITQSYDQWRILVRDDGSLDGTCDIISTYMHRFPERIVNIKDTLGNLGASGNFARLLEESSAKYIMFCDADDLWLPDKIKLTILKMHAMENAFGVDIPLLVHTDLTVTDDSLEIIGRSFWRYQNINPHRDSINYLLMQNVVTGCTMMINRKLCNLVLPIPPDAIMHDWWIALVASLFGRLGFVAIPTIYYRQHESNVLGSRKWGTDFILRRAIQVSHIRRQLVKNRLQAALLLERFGDKLASDNRKLLVIFSQLSNYSVLGRRYYLMKYRLFKNGIIRNLAAFLYI